MDLDATYGCGGRVSRKVSTGPANRLPYAAKLLKSHYRMANFGRQMDARGFKDAIFKQLDRPSVRFGRPQRTTDSPHTVYGQNCSWVGCLTDDSGLSCHKTKSSFFNSLISKFG